MTFAADVYIEVNVRLDIGDAGNLLDISDGGIIENSRGRLIRSERRAAAISWIIVTTLRIDVRHCHCENALAEHADFIEQIERAKSGEHVALQSESKRNHRDNHGDPNNYTHRRECRAQLRFAQVPQRQPQ